MENWVGIHILELLKKGQTLPIQMITESQTAFENKKARSPLEIFQLFPF